MPNVRHLLGDHGVTFTNEFVTTSECGPSRARILTGEYSHHTGVLQNFGPRGYQASTSASNLAVWLHTRGYETALVGKYLNDYTIYGHDRIPAGWDDWRRWTAARGAVLRLHAERERPRMSTTARSRRTTRPTC